MDALELHTVDGAPVVVATIDDGKVNALTLDLVGELHGVVDAVGADSALVVTGRPGTFSGGLDLDVVGAGGPPAQALVGALGRLLVAVLSSTRPVVVAADGHAVAAGAMLLLCADLAVVSDRPARFGFTEVPAGLPLPEGVVDLVAARVAPSAVLGLTAHGRLVGPGEAVDVGLADLVVPGAELHDRAVAEASRLAALPIEAYAETKARVNGRLIGRLAHALS